MTLSSTSDAKAAGEMLGIAEADKVGANAKAHVAKPINKSRFIVRILQPACSRAWSNPPIPRWFRNWKMKCRWREDAVRRGELFDTLASSCLDAIAGAAN
jgi:hypothetical protein